MDMGHRVVGRQHIGFPRARGGAPHIDSPHRPIWAQNDSATCRAFTQIVVSYQHAVKSGQRWILLHG